MKKTNTELFLFRMFHEKLVQIKKIFSNIIIYPENILPFIIVFTLLLSVIIIALTPSSSGYELSIYGVYSIYLWIIISINIFFSTYSIIRSCDNQSINYYYSYFSIITIGILVLFLPIIRGYYSISRGGGDLYHHIFVSSQIINSGHFLQSNIYPGIHILTSCINFFLTDLIIVTLLISAIFMVLIMLYLYILGNTIVGRKNGGLLISILSIPLIFSYVYYGFYPFFFAIVTILLILFLYQKTQLFPKNENAFYICVLFLSMFIVFCHPLVAIFLIITFLLVIFYNLFKRFVIKLQPSKNFDLNIFTVIAISFIFWFALVRLYIHTLTDMILTNLGGVDERTIINDQIDLVSSTHPASIWLYIEGFIKIYGPISIYLLLSIGFIVYILTQYYNKKTIFETDLFYSLLFCLALSLGISLFIGHSIYFEPVRVLMYSLIFSMILSGLFLYRIWLSINETQHKKIFSIIVTLITTILYMLCFFNLYQSPWTNMPNTAFTYEDKYGNDWILEYSNRELPIIKDDSTISKYSSYYFESQNSRNSEKMNEYLMIIPSNFGYNQYRNLGDAFATLPEDKFYMSTTEMMKIAPYAAREERRGWLDWFTDTDFIRLLNDPTVNSIYSNDEYSLFMVYRG